MNSYLPPLIKKLHSTSERCPTGYYTAKLRWEYEQFLAKFMFFLDLGWKAVGLFYAILGGILAIYFAKESSNKDVVKFLLYAPLIMSIILSFIFSASGFVWVNRIPKVDEIVKKLEMTTTPNFRILTSVFFCVYAYIHS